MGIPLYYKKIIHKFPDVIQISKIYTKKVNHIFFDLNCAIHPCCANKTKENEMCEVTSETWKLKSAG